MTMPRSRSRKPVFVGGVTGFGEICTDIIYARAFLNGEEIYYPWTTWKRITSESGLGPSNPDSSDFTAFRHTPRKNVTSRETVKKVMDRLLRGPTSV